MCGCDLTGSLLTSYSQFPSPKHTQREKEMQPLVEVEPLNQSICQNQPPERFEEGDTVLTGRTTLMYTDTHCDVLIQRPVCFGQCHCVCFSVGQKNLSRMKVRGKNLQGVLFISSFMKYS